MARSNHDRIDRIEAPGVSPAEFSAADLVKRIRKLRWIGREEEAQRMQSRLERLPEDGRDGSIADELCTD